MGPFEFLRFMVQCSNCHHGRSLLPNEHDNMELIIKCTCGTEYSVIDGIVNYLISDDPFSMYSFISTLSFEGVETINIGEEKYITFPKPINIVHKVFLTPYYIPCALAAAQISSKGFSLVSSSAPGSLKSKCGDEVKVSWHVYGIDDHYQEPWRQMLTYSRQAFASENYLASIILTEAAFESFTDSALAAGLRNKGLDNDSITRFLISVEMQPKVNPLMNNFFGLKLKDSFAWRDWEKKVLPWRNRISHGVKIKATRDEAQLAFSTVIRAIFFFHKTVFTKLRTD